MDHLKVLEKLIQKPAEAGLKVNAENNSFDVQKPSTLVSGLARTEQDIYGLK